MTPSEPRVLVVEDDARIRTELLDALRQAGFDVSVAVTLGMARAASERRFDLVLLDLGLPDGDGLDLVRELRGAGRAVPILILTARDAPDQRVAGLEAGADDYVVKPFHLPELVARVRGLMRRSGRAVEGGFARHQDLWIDLLAFFVRHPGRAWTRDQLLDRVWGNDFKGDARTVDLHVRRLRAKIERDAADPRYIETVWGVGYRMTEGTD
jgi:DNA-binding response OmpR family regulator